LKLATNKNLALLRRTFVQEKSTEQLYKSGSLVVHRWLVFDPNPEGSDTTEAE